MKDPQSDSNPGRKPLFHFWRCFWLTFLVVSLAYAWYCFYAPPNEIAWAKSYVAAQTQAAEGDKPMILYFSGQWCAPCRIMKRNVWADKEVTEAVNAAFVPVMIDVGDPESASVMQQFGVGAAPNTVIADSNGNVFRKQAGGMSKADFLEFLGDAKPTAARLANFN